MENRPIYPLDELEFTLEERSDLIKNHDEEMKYICSSLQHYLEDVEHAIDMGMSHSVVSHLTYNMVLTIAKGLTDLTIYYYLRGAYLLDDEYDTAYEIWKSVYGHANSIIPLLAKLEEENYFDDDVDWDEFKSDIVAPICMKAQGKDNYLSIYRFVALKSSSSLMHSLSFFLRAMVNILNDLKNATYEDLHEEYDRIYEANYKLYKKQYWPTEGRHFRVHIERHIPHFEKLTPEYLGKLQWEEQKDFEHTEAGVLWRDYFADKKDLYFEAKRIKINEEQWKYFFKNICRFEEYDQWIKELRKPPESEKDKQKRERLLKTNRVFNLQPAKTKHVDILLLYKFIDTRFITQYKFVYEWYALHFILRRVGVITTCTVEDFVRQMNDKEWFANVEKNCSANEINTYGFLTGKSPDDWNIRYKPDGTNKATKNAINNIYRMYSYLEDSIDEIYAKE